MQSHISSMCAIFSNVIFHLSFKSPAWIDDKSHNSCMCAISPNARLHMSSQIACFNRCKVTIVADVRNFSIKWFSNVFSNRLIEHMQSHISCMCVIFSNVSFHVSSQIACLNKCKVTIVACVRFPQMLDYTCPLKSPASTDAKSQ